MTTSLISTMLPLIPSLYHPLLSLPMKQCQWHTPPPLHLPSPQDWQSSLHQHLQAGCHPCHWTSFPWPCPLCWQSLWPWYSPSECPYQPYMVLPSQFLCNILSLAWQQATCLLFNIHGHMMCMGTCHDEQVWITMAPNKWLMPDHLFNMTNNWPCLPDPTSTICLSMCLCLLCFSCMCFTTCTSVTSSARWTIQSSSLDTLWTTQPTYCECLLSVTIFFLSHIFFLVLVVCQPYFHFAPLHEEVDLYLLAFPHSCPALCFFL